MTRVATRVGPGGGRAPGPTRTHDGSGSSAHRPGRGPSSRRSFGGCDRPRRRPRSPPPAKGAGAAAGRGPGSARPRTFAAAAPCAACPAGTTRLTSPWRPAGGDPRASRRPLRTRPPGPHPARHRLRPVAASHGRPSPQAPRPPGRPVHPTHRSWRSAGAHPGAPSPRAPRAPGRPPGRQHPAHRSRRPAGAHPGAPHRRRRRATSAPAGATPRTTSSGRADGCRPTSRRGPRRRLPRPAGRTVSPCPSAGRQRSSNVLHGIRFPGIGRGIPGRQTHGPGGADALVSAAVHAGDATP